MIELLLALQLVTLHRPDGRAIFINPAEVTAVAVPRREDAKTTIHGANCVVFLSDRHFFGVIEPCVEVNRLLGE